MERVLDWRSSHDERSRSYPIRSLTAPPPRSYSWRCTPRLDQGIEGACVGFAWAHELGATPQIWSVNDDLAFGVYRRAQQLDEWSGEDYDGTSVLAGAKAVVESAKITGYRWSFSITDLAYGVGRTGPAVLGVNWYEAAFEPDDQGRISVEGDIAGGHAILCRGVNMKRQEFLLRNSWGIGWGTSGDCWVSFEGMEKMLANEGEACFPIRLTRR